MFKPLIFATLVLVASSAFADVPSSVTWLNAQQTTDGSWGTVPALQFSYTQEAVDALRAAHGPDPIYYRGITWLENHDPANNDAQARRLGTLTDRGDPTSDALGSLASGATPSAVYGGTAGWGLGGALEPSPFDTALALRVEAKQASLPDMSDEIAYLKSVRLPGSGWERIPGNGLDILTTAEVIRALAPYRTVDPSLYPVLDAASTALMAAVNSGSSTQEKASALIVAEIELPGVPQIAQWRSDLLTTQQSDGSWGDDVLTTSMALYALTAANGGLGTDDYVVVNIPDPLLRAAINAALGHNTGDAITRGELRQLTSLDLSNSGVTDLTGLEYAINLAPANLNLTGDTITTPQRPNTPPTAHNDLLAVRRRVPLAIFPTVNDTDPNGDFLSITALSQPANGQVELLSDGVTVVYTPPLGFGGSDSFTYTVTDDLGGTSSAVVTLHVRATAFPAKHEADVIK
jgi:hypothetical protein